METETRRRKKKSFSRTINIRLNVDFKIRCALFIVLIKLTFDLKERTTTTTKSSIKFYSRQGSDRAGHGIWKIADSLLRKAQIQNEQHFFGFSLYELNLRLIPRFFFTFFLYFGLNAILVMTFLRKSNWSECVQYADKWMNAQMWEVWVFLYIRKLMPRVSDSFESFSDLSSISWSRHRTRSLF